MRESARPVWLELEDLVTYMVAIEVRVIVLGGPGAVRHERRSDDRGAAGIVAVLVDGRCVGRRTTVHGARTTRVVVVALAKVPRVVRPRPALVYFVPSLIANIANEEACARGVRVEGEAEGVA